MIIQKAFSVSSGNLTVKLVHSLNSLDSEALLHCIFSSLVESKTIEMDTSRTEMYRVIVLWIALPSGFKLTYLPSSIEPRSTYQQARMILLHKPPTATTIKTKIKTTSPSPPPWLKISLNIESK